MKSVIKIMLFSVCFMIVFTLSACHISPTIIGTADISSPTSEPFSTLTPQPPLAPSLTPILSPTLLKTTETTTPTPIFPGSQKVTLSVESEVSLTETASVGCKIIPTPQVNRISKEQDGVLITGRFALCDAPSEATFDLDTGELGTYDVLPFWQWETNDYKSETDIAIYMGFNQSDNKFSHTLREINGAQVENSRNENPSIDDCKKYVSQGEIESYAYGEVGDLICVITNQGRVSVVRVESVNSYGWGSMEILFITWKK